MGKVFTSYLDGQGRFYTCTTCHTHLGLHDDVVSKCFQGRTGRAYLFKHVENVCLGQKEQRLLMTGLHTVADVSCAICHTIVGWKYVYAYEDSQKYKENKYIIERSKISKENNTFSS
ncbi:Yippee/Mis18 [Paraphysoderma sedebokerense]|nr:Yippee/Mis18 [Paraphysoderma sedebokerense]